MPSCIKKPDKKPLQQFAHLYKQSDTIQLQLKMDTANTLPANRSLVGFNTAFTYGSGIENSPALVQLARDAGTQVLRFPGGTVANFYHPAGPGYGFVKKEMGSIKAFAGLWQYQQQQQENIRKPFAHLAKKLQAEVIVVANMVTGTPEEALELLDYFHQQEVEVSGVELGNELYFKYYRKQFPDVQAYIRACRPFANAIRKQYPDIPLIVCAPGKMEDGQQGRQPAFFDEWNQQLARENFFDGYAVHTYLSLKDCQNNGGQGALKKFSCFYDKLSEDVPGQIHSLAAYFERIYGKERRMYITEWNINPPGLWSNTFAHGAAVSLMLMAMSETPSITTATFHNFAAGNENYAFIAAMKKDNVSSVVPTAAYRAFTPFYALVMQQARQASLSVSGGAGAEPYITAWWSPARNSWSFWYVNPYNHACRLDLPQVDPSSASIRCIRGDSFMSGSGGKQVAGKVVPSLQEEEYPLNVRNLVAPPFSWGIIEVVL